MTEIGASNADQREPAASDGWRAWLAAGGLVAALGASSCCVLPLVLFSLGMSGAWIGSLTALSPYQPVFLGIGLLCVGAGLLAAYRRPAMSCEPGSACASPSPRRLTKAVLWAAAALMLAVLVFPFVAPLFVQA